MISLEASSHSAGQMQTRWARNERAPARAGVRLWLHDLDAVGPLARRDQSPLSEDELVRAARLRASRLRERFIASRVVLRHTLGELLHCEPQDLNIEFSARGKPFLRSCAAQGCAPDFSLSYSGNLLLLGVSWDGPIGVDLAHITSEFDPLPVARSHFAEAEARWLQQLPREECPAAFAQIWTLKEAWAKAAELSLDEVLPQTLVGPGASSTEPLHEARAGRRGFEARWPEGGRGAAPLWHSEAHHPGSWSAEASLLWTGRLPPEGGQRLNVACHDRPDRSWRFWQFRQPRREGDWIMAVVKG